MRIFPTIALGLALVTVGAHAQTLADYQSTISGQSPTYYNSLDNSLAPSAGTGTFSASATGTGFAPDYFGNANAAASFSSSSAQLSLATGANIINGSGAANSIGSLSLLFYTPNTALTGTQYIFSNGDVAGANGNQFSLDLSAGVLQLKAGNKTITLPALTGGQWYYFGTTWNFSGANSSPYGISYYLGIAGQSSFVSTGFVQRGGTGNISSTAIFGDGGAFVLSGHQAGGAGFELPSSPGLVDELAAWDSQLTSDQFASQFNGLAIPVPEPATFALLGLGGVLVLIRKRKA